MKYKDYYRILGVERDADAASIKTAYRKLARKYHPDVSKEGNAEAMFKDVSEAYNTLKDPEKRGAYDQLGSHQAGQDFQPPPQWGQQFGDGKQPFGDGGFSFDDLDLADLFAGLNRGGDRTRRAREASTIPGQDFEVPVEITLQNAMSGVELNLDLALPEYDEHGFSRRVPHPVTVRIPKGATDGQRLRVPGKGGKGANGGRDGDLYLTISLRPHALFRVSGHDVYLDLPVAPWEAVLGTSVALPTPGGTVRLTIPPGTHAGQKFRLAKRGLPKPRAGEGDLFAVVQIVVPDTVTDRERALWKELSEATTFNPRQHFDQEAPNARGTQ
jgi:curved DNA-binding protein